MAHEVFGERAVYAKTPAWHRIGTVLDDVFTAEQALFVINPDKMPVQKWTAGVQDPATGKWYSTNEFVGTVQLEDRSDTDNLKIKVFDFPSPDHSLIQDWEQLAWMDAIVGNEEGAHYEAAVKLRGGTQTILTINLGKTVLDPNGRADVNYKYLFGFNSHNRSWPLGAKFADMRAECANMAAMVMRDGTKPEYKTKHTTNLMERVAMAQRVLGLELSWHKLYTDTAEVLIQTEMSDNQFQRLLDGIFVDEVGDRDVESTETVRAIYALNPSQASLYGTWWGGFNAVTYFNDWQTVVRGGKTSKDEMRFLRQFDDTKNLKQQAWDRIVEMAEV
jgi:Domain of unknown function (DUF932)